MTTSCQGCGAPLTQPPFGRPRKWCGERCRKRSYGDPCVDCGARTSYGAETARIPEPRCVACATARKTIWTPGLVIERIREWNAVNGEPPAAPDWNPWHARRLGDEGRARRFEQANGHWPSFKSVIERFGTWSNAIRAAGFTPRQADGGGGNNTRKRNLRERIAA